ncbi:tigger transposable element-derived 1-like [Pelobates cultripes]|uniref:Tigger transposable element-derived 1-like n=1 Tax=Pelobates cultripes TaxID=61616 RepID=A0AAD1TLW5_PELCU|nr:tigger transposable element-derived 1-like [Pelobates cultripes]
MKEKITGRDAAKGVTRVSKQRPPVLEEVEKLLLLWIEQKQHAGDSVTKAIICEKAKALHVDLLKQPGTSADAEGFKASRGWFERFKTRSGIDSVVRHEEAASSDVAAAEEFTTDFLEVIVSEGYLPQHVFNCDETGLFWKRMPKRTFITEEETSLPGHKPMKDRLTLLFCANASGDLKIKPLLVYHSENPRAFKKHKWVNAVFGPAVKRYLVHNNLPLKAMLLMDNAPAHPPGLEEDLLEDFNFIKVMFFPPNTTPLVQPMDQQILSNFKKLYTREPFRRCFEMTDHSSLILLLLHLHQSQVLDENVYLGRTMCLEVTEEDVYKLVEEHDRDLTTEELVELQKEAMEEQTAFEEEEKMSEEQLSSTELKEACQMWVNLQTFVQQHHPDKALAHRPVSSFHTDIMSPFRGMLKRRQRKMELYLPKFKLDQKYTLRTSLEELGILDIFTGKANLTVLTEERNLKLSEVVLAMSVKKCSVSSSSCW